MPKGISLKAENYYSNYSHKNQYVINFLGNLDKNIDQLINKVQCCCGAGKQLRQILKIYANKLIKVRNQRDKLRKSINQLQQTFIKDIQCLQKQIDKMKLQKEGQRKIYQNYWNGNQFYQQNPQRYKENDNFSIINNAKLIQSCTYQKNVSRGSKVNFKIEVQQANNQKKYIKQLQQIMKKYNLTERQLNNIVQDDNVFQIKNKKSFLSSEYINKSNNSKNNVSKKHKICHSIKNHPFKLQNKQNKKS